MIRSIFQALTDFIQNVFERMKEWRQRLEQLCEQEEYEIQLEQEDIKYWPEKVDILLGLQCKEYLLSIFPDGIQAGVQNMSNDELLGLFQMIERDAAEIMGVSVDGVDFYTTMDEPYCHYGGYYNPEDNTFHINMTYVYSATTNYIEYEIYAIFHELKHARQFAAVKGRLNHTKDYGYSDKLLDEWEKNMSNYIPMEENDELYMKQPLEMDSRGFESIVSGERQFEVI